MTDTNNDATTLSADSAVGNPFVLPADEEVFRMRDEEKKKKQNELKENARLSIHQKMTNSAKMGRIRRVKLTDEGGDKKEDEDGTVSCQSQQTRGLVAAATAVMSGDRRREKENMADFIAKKREMFLVQMSLDTKREEIRKLEEKAQMKEEALKKSELMLEEDAIRFDTFLKENDKKAHDAIRKAEKETKAKTDKVQEIKRLSQQIQSAQSEMSKLKDQLEDCQKYKEFLDSLTPQEYFEEEKEKKRIRQQERNQLKKKEKLKEAELQKAKNLSDMDVHTRERLEKESKQQPTNPKRKENIKSNKSKDPNSTGISNGDELELSSSGEDIPMYFQHPQQLLDIFTALEESNLFLIQNSQETEQALEELKQNFRDTKKKMDQKTTLLQSNIDSLRSQINYENEKAETLKQKSQASTGEDKQQQVLIELHEKVKEVYKRCGFDADTNPSTLFMLTDLEARLEDLLSAIEQMPEDYVVKAEKEKEKERRERVRQERITLQQNLYEERMKKSMERSMQAPKKRRGRQVMFRSKPLRQMKQAEVVFDQDQDDQEDQQYFQ